jgi:hypothetical protein
MQAEERRAMVRVLDKELRPFREAARDKAARRPLLRVMRRVLAIPVAEMAEELEVRASVVFRLEESERKGTISLRCLRRMAEAMGCEVVYGIVLKNGEKLGNRTEGLRG